MVLNVFKEQKHINRLMIEDKQEMHLFLSFINFSAQRLTERAYVWKFGR